LPTTRTPPFPDHNNGRGESALLPTENRDGRSARVVLERLLQLVHRLGHPEPPVLALEHEADVEAAGVIRREGDKHVTVLCAARTCLAADVLGMLRPERRPGR
jgi:hypothetical protein